MSFLTKSDRQKCWDAKDRYWECLDANPENTAACENLRSIYVSSCPAQWVSFRYFKIASNSLENE